MQSWMIGMVSGTVLAGFWPTLPPGYLFPLFIAVALLASKWAHAIARILCGLACGSALALLYGTILLDHRLDEACVGNPVFVSGHVSSLVNQARVPHGSLRQRFEFAVAELSPAQCSGPRKILLSYYGDENIYPGDKWQFEVNLKKPWGLANPGSFNSQLWFAQEGIDAVGSVRGSGRQLLLARGVHSSGNRLRQSISDRIAGTVAGPETVAILQALTVADKNGLDWQLRKLFQHYGISHLLVISGLHVGMVAAVGYLLGGLVQRIFGARGSIWGWLPGVFALALACCYGALAGYSLATQRAVCMLACFVIAGLLGRKSASSNNLLLAATLVLVLNPLAALGSGFWLSFGAVVALLWFATWQQGITAIGGVLRTHGFMSLVMLPMGAQFFAGSSVVAMFANMLMIPLIGWVVVPLGLLAVISFLCGLPIEDELWQLAVWPLERLFPAADAVANRVGEWLFLPLSADLPRVLLGVLAVFLLILPGGPVLKLLAPVLLLPLLLPPGSVGRAPTRDIQVTVLDVGQGTAVLIRAGERALLFDAGGGDPSGVNMGSLVVLPYLREQGITSLDTVVISHPDLDHSAGAGIVLASMRAERLRYGGEPAVMRGGRPCVAGESWRWPGGQIFQFLSPPQTSSLSSNDSSCVLLVQVGDYRLLLPGDIEADQERALVQYWADALHSDWLLAAHHGSRTSSSVTFLKRVQPSLAVISSGYANRFGHPHPNVIQRLERQGAEVFSTAVEGALEFQIAPGRPLKIDAYRRSARYYWM